MSFREFAARNPEVPMFVGLSNVTELFDADSVGLNAILARLSSESEAVYFWQLRRAQSQRYRAREVTAAKMMFLARKRGSVPKDLGIDLLILKDKRSHEEPYDRSIESGANVELAEKGQEPTELDRAGVFRIAVDRAEGLIVAVHYRVGDMSKPVNIVKGKTAQVVYLKVLELELLSNLDHAAYLGVELAKAEIALRTGKGYVQDAELFKRKEC